MRLQLNNILRLAGLYGPGEQLAVVDDLHDRERVWLRSGRFQLGRRALQARRRRVRGRGVVGAGVRVSRRHVGDDLRLLHQMKVVRTDHRAVRVQVLVLVDDDLFCFGALVIYIFR